MGNAIVAGVYTETFYKPGGQPPYRVMGAHAIRGAMQDADIGPEKIEQVFASYVQGVTGAGQHCVYDVFQTGVPIVNVNNACASGSTALFLARQAVQAGALECALVVGFEEMPAGPVMPDRSVEYAGDRVERVLDAQGWPNGAAMTARWFGAAGQAYLDAYDAEPELFARVAVKSRAHAANNPHALFTEPLTVEQVMQSKLIYGDYMTRLMACPPTCGAAAALVVSAGFEIGRASCRERV